MMMKTKLYTLALGAFFVPAMLVAGCGGVPGNAVAEVDGTAIEKNDFEHWLTVAAKSGGQAARSGAQAARLRGLRQAEAQDHAEARQGPAEGHRRPAQDPVQAGVQRAARPGAAAARSPSSGSRARPSEQNIKVSDAEVKKSFDKQKKEAFPKAADFEKFLKDSGQTEEDILKRVRLDTLSNKIREKVTKGKDKVTDAQIEAYYNKNKARFAQPERRDLRIVLTKSKAKAEQAKKALDSGESFKSVAKKYSIDQASKAQGGKLPAVAKGQQEKALDTAIFKAKKGELVGPVKTQFGYYVFEVTKVTPASQQTLAQAKETIKQTLASQNQQKALDKFVKSFRKRWKEKTDCREGYRTQDCKNAPKATPTPDAPTAPGGAAARPAHGHARRQLSDPKDSAAAVERLDALTRRLRVECPWDREQDERSIVPHTVEEAYELAAAAHAGDDAKLLDELGDVLFQVHFLSLLLEERGGGLAGRGRRALPPEADPPPSPRLRRRRGRARRRGAAQLGRDQARRARAASRGSSARCPRTCPGPLYARKVQRRAATSGFDFDHIPYDAVEGELEELRAAEGDRDAAFHEVGDVLFAAVNVARKLKVDPELALRAASDRFRGRVEAAAALAARAGADWDDLGPNAQLGYYAQARLAETKETPSEPDRDRPRPPDPRLPREPDGRGRRRPALRRAGPRRGAVAAPRPASSRRPSCATAATPGWARASRRRSATSTARSPRRSAASTCSTRRGSTAR